jgi:hypothetical protein
MKLLNNLPVVSVLAPPTIAADRGATPPLHAGLHALMRERRALRSRLPALGQRQITAVLCAVARKVAYLSARLGFAISSCKEALHAQGRLRLATADHQSEKKLKPL